jgi:hypothetical protein
MAAFATDRGPQAASLLLGDLHGIQSACPDVMAVAAELAERMADAIEQVGVLVDEPGRSVVATGLFVAVDDQEQVPGRLGFGPGVQRSAGHARIAAPPDLRLCRAVALHTAQRPELA